MALLTEYSFDEGAGPVATDSVASRTLTRYSTGWSASGHTGAGAAEFFYGALGPNVSLPAHTTMFWLYPAGDVQGFEMFFKVVVGSVRISLHSNYGQPTCIYTGPGTNLNIAGAAIGRNAWFHLAVTSDGHTVMVFVNGAQVATSAYNTSLDPVNFSEAQVGATSGVSSPEGQIIGAIDDLRVFDTALTAAEISGWAATPAALPSAGSSFTGAVTLTGSGTFAVTGKPAAPGFVARTGLGALTIAGKPTASGPVALTGSGAIAITGAAASSASGTLALTGAGALALAGKPTPTGALALAGSGGLGLSGAASGTASGTLSRSGSGSLTMAGKPALVGARPLSSTGTLTATGTPRASGVLELVGVGSLTIAPPAPPSVAVPTVLTLVARAEPRTLAAIPDVRHLAAVPHLLTLIPLET